jgi:hypothetical protein
MLGMARWRIAWLLILLSALAAAVAGVRPAHGKGNAWIITGGELGDYATVIGLDPDQIAAPGSQQLPAASQAPAEDAYNLYSANGVFATAAGFAPEPILRYYPQAHVLESLNSEWVSARWTLLAPRTARDLDAVITVALWKRNQGELALGLTAANWTWRDMSNARYTFTPIGRADLAVAVNPPDSAELAMHHLVDTVSRPPAGMTEERPAYTVTIQGLGQVNWGGQLGSYSPPNDGQPGKFWAEGPAASGPSEYYAATLGLDQFIADAVARRDSQSAVRSTGKSLRAGAVVVMRSIEVHWYFPEPADSQAMAWLKANPFGAWKLFRGDAPNASPATANSAARNDGGMSTTRRTVLFAAGVFLTVGFGWAGYAWSRRHLVRR